MEQYLRVGVISSTHGEFYPQKQLAVLRALGQAHVPVVALIDPLRKLQRRAADGAGRGRQLLVRKSVALRDVARERRVVDRCHLSLQLPGARRDGKRSPSGAPCGTGCLRTRYPGRQQYVCK